jgi:hypothetical protein
VPHRPNHPRELVGHRDGGFIVAAPSGERHRPPLDRRGSFRGRPDPPLRGPEDRSGAVCQQAAEIAVASLTDPA